MSGFALYLVILWTLGIAANLYYAGRGGYRVTPGVLIFSALWAGVNILLLFTIGLT